MMDDTGSLRGLPRWPAGATELPGGEPSRGPAVQWRRGLAASAAFALGCGVHMAAAMTPNTSWEHHPFSGPLVALHESRHPLDYVVSGAVLLGLGAGLCGPAFRATFLSVAISIATAVAWVALSMWTAAVASC